MLIETRKTGMSSQGVETSCFFGSILKTSLNLTLSSPLPLRKRIIEIIRVTFLSKYALYKSTYICKKMLQLIVLSTVLTSKLITILILLSKEGDYLFYICCRFSNDFYNDSAIFSTIKPHHYVKNNRSR